MKRIGRIRIILTAGIVFTGVAACSTSSISGHGTTAPQLSSPGSALACPRTGQINCVGESPEPAPSRTTGSATGSTGGRASSAVAEALTSIPSSVFDAIGRGSFATAPTALHGSSLTADGKPRILYVGADYCPYCAAERWPLAVALSQFGRLTRLGEVSSSPTEVYPNTASLSFHGASYTSELISFTGVETSGTKVVNGNYVPLDTLSAADKAIFDRLAPSGAIPFLDIGGEYLISGASFDPGILKGDTQAQIAADLSDKTSAIAQAVDGTANVITAAICRMTANKPASVCLSRGVIAAATALPSR